MTTPTQPVIVQVASDPTFLGLPSSDWITLLAVIISAAVAVAITLWLEPRRNIQAEQNRVLRTLIRTRHLAADPEYQAAINLIPIEFEKSSSVMKALREYREVVDTDRSGFNEEQHRQHLELTVQRQNKLIGSIASYLGFDLTEEQLSATPYISGGFAEIFDLQVKAQQAWPRIADALEMQNTLTRALLTTQKADDGDATEDKS